MKNIQKSIGEVVATRGRYGHWIKIIIMLIDMLCVNCAYFLVLLLLGGRISSSPGMIWLLVNLSYLPVILIFNSTYDERVVYIGSDGEGDRYPHLLFDRASVFYPRGSTFAADSSGIRPCAFRPAGYLAYFVPETIEEIP